MQVIVCRRCGKHLHDGPLPGSITAVNALIEKLYAECECQVKNPSDELDITGMSALEIQKAVEQRMEKMDLVWGPDIELEEGSK